MSFSRSFKRANVFCLLLALLSALLVSCSGLLRNYGVIHLSEAVTRNFEQHRPNAALRYYVSGSALYPNAILGLDRALRLDPRTLWKEIAMTDNIMKELTEDMKRRVDGLGQSLYGFDVKTPEGRFVGVWYSIPTARTLVRMNDDGTIWIETPDIDIYEKLEVKYQKDF
jgi:hypothetical protein